MTLSWENKTKNLTRTSAAHEQSDGRRSGRAWWRGGDGGRRPGRGPCDAGCQRMSHFCGVLRRARAAQAAARGPRWRAGGSVGGASARVRFTVSGELRSWARRVARIFAEPSGALAARQKNRRARGGCGREEAMPCRFRALLPHPRAAQRSCAVGENPQKSPGLRTTTLHTVAWAAGGMHGLCMRAVEMPFSITFSAAAGVTELLRGWDVAQKLARLALSNVAERGIGSRGRVGCGACAM